MAYIGNSPAELVTELDNAVVTADKLANDAVTAAKIVDGTIIADDLSTGIIVNSKVAANAAIAATKLAISGGSNITLQSDGTFDLDASVDVSTGYSIGGTAIVDSSRNATFVTVGTPAGSASAPAYTFSTDTNTGMFKRGTDQIGFTAGGTEYVAIGSFGLAVDTIQNKASAGDLTLNVAGDIVLDADGAQIRLKDNNVEFGVLSHEDPNLIIKPQVQDGHLIFKGNDGGNTITALTLDMSEAGAATFNSSVTVGGTVSANGLTVSSDVTFTDASPNIYLIETDTTDLNTALGGNAGTFKILTRNDSNTNIGTRFAVDHSTGDISFYEDTGTTAKFFWDASAESLGIGTTSPATKLHIAGSSSVRNTIVSNVTLDGGVSVGYPYDGFGFGIDFIGRDYGNAVRNYAGIYTEMESQSSSTGGGDAGFTTGLSFYTNAGGASDTDPVERLRISSEGNLLVGTANVNIRDSSTNDGLVYRTGNSLDVTNNGNTVAIFNRNISDGNIVTFRKGAADVGAIGTQGGRLTIGDGATGLRIAGDLNTIVPWNTTTNVLRDSAIDLGQGTQRFKDLHLSGTANVGTSIGIGTSDPSALLHLKSTAANASPTIILENTNNAQVMNIDYWNNGGAVQSRISYLEGPAAWSFIPNTSTGNSALYIAYDGDVGIGNINPSVPLTVTSNSGANALALRARSNDDYAFLQFYNHAGSALRGQIYNHAGAIGFSTSSSGTERLRISTAGAVTMPAQPSFAATRSQGHVGDNTYYICPNVYFNTGNHYNASTGTFTAPVAGIYAIVTNFMTQSTIVETNQYYAIHINNSGFQYVYNTGTTAAHYRFSWAGNVSLAANDTVRVYTANTSLYGNGNYYTYFSAALLG